MSRSAPSRVRAPFGPSPQALRALQPSSALEGAREVRARSRDPLEAYTSIFDPGARTTPPFSTTFVPEVRHTPPFSPLGCALHLHFRPTPPFSALGRALHLHFRHNSSLRCATRPHVRPWGAPYTTFFYLHLHFRPWGAPYTSIFDLHLHFRPWGAHYTSIFDIIRP